MVMNREALSFVLVATALSAAACEPDLHQVFDSSAASNTGGSGTSTTTANGGSTSTSTTDSTGPSGGSGGNGGTGAGTTTSPTGSGGSMCDPLPDGDVDADGFTPAQGDCDDCDPAVNPNALEIAGGVDDNCDGSLDVLSAPCDEAIPLDSLLPAQVVQAADLCKSSAGAKDWGIIGAVWALPDGATPSANDLQNFHRGHGVLPDFGQNVKPRAGKKLIALSNGTARRPNDPGYQSGFDKGYQNAPPPGFPKDIPSCPGAVAGQPHDATALAFSVNVPSNVHGFSYDFDFYAFDFPKFVCNQYDDTFFSLLTPQLAGQPDTNIAYDEMGSPVTLNGANFRVCGCMNGPPCMAAGKSYDCPLGTMQLLGTGFDAAASGEDRGATGWLTTTVPVEPGSSISLRWGIYDAGDGAFDSTVLLDNWQWITTPGVVLGTKPAQ
jgi:hypothetical protein